MKKTLRDYLPILLMLLCTAGFGILLLTGVLDLNTIPQLVDHRPGLAVAVILALCQGADYILMDEPFVGLDPLAAHQLKTLMRRFCDGGGAIFFSTHVLEVAEKLCDRVAILRKGQLVREGAMEQVRGDDTLEEVFLELEDTGEAL